MGIHGAFPALDDMSLVDGARVVALAGGMMRPRQTSIFRKFLAGQFPIWKMERGDYDAIDESLSEARRQLWR